MPSLMCRTIWCGRSGSYYDGHKWSAVKTTKNAVFDKYGREREIFLEDGEKIDYRYHFQVDSGSSEYIQVNIFRSYYKDVSEVQTSSANFGDQITTEKRKVKVLRDKNQQFIQETGSIQVWVDGLRTQRLLQYQMAL